MKAGHHKKNFNVVTARRNHTGKKEKFISHHALLTKMDRYKPFIRFRQDMENLDALRKTYMKREGVKHIQRARRDQNFVLGKRAGYHPDLTLSDLHREDLQRDAEHRQKIARKIKSIYRKNYNLLKQFKTRGQSKDHLKNQTRVNRDSIKTPHRLKDQTQKKKVQKHFFIKKRFRYASKNGYALKSNSLHNKGQMLALKKRFEMAAKSKSNAIPDKNYNVCKTANRAYQPKVKTKSMTKEM